MFSQKHSVPHVRTYMWMKAHGVPKNSRRHQDTQWKLEWTCLHFMVPSLFWLCSIRIHVFELSYLGAGEYTFVRTEKEASGVRQSRTPKPHRKIYGAWGVGGSRANPSSPIFAANGRREGFEKPASPIVAANGGLAGFVKPEPLSQCVLPTAIANLRIAYPVLIGRSYQYSFCIKKHVSADSSSSQNWFPPGPEQANPSWNKYIHTYIYICIHTSYMLCVAICYLHNICICIHIYIHVFTYIHIRNYIYIYVLREEPERLYFRYALYGTWGRHAMRKRIRDKIIH